jgi:hypothetical protein
MAVAHARAFRIVLRICYLLLAAAITWLLVAGIDYYSQPLDQRPHHPDFRSLRPAGTVGHGLGIVGSLQILLLLLYSLRKRWHGLAGKGHIGRWLDGHIFLGVSGPLLVTLHTSFKVQGLVAVSYWSMMAVALSGVFGRYLYLQLPRNVLGEALNLEEILAQLAETDRRLRETYGLDERTMSTLESFTSAGGSLWRLPMSNILLGMRLRPHLPAGASPAVLASAKARVLLGRRILFHNRIRELFHYWHVIHKPFAFLMLIIMVVHVGVTVALGYRWVF